MPKTISITVSITPVGPNYDFLYGEPANQGVVSANGDLNLSNTKDQTKLEFTLDQATVARGIEFQTNEAAFWICEERNGKCPKGPYNGHEFHTIQTSGQNNEKLSVRGDNDLILKYRYALRCRDRQGNLVQHDPEIENGGGNNSLFGPHKMIGDGLGKRLVVELPLRIRLE